jgi:putative two-component system response regulator
MGDTALEKPARGTGRQIIMLVDDQVPCLDMGKKILKDKYVVYPLSSGYSLFEILNKVTPDLVLLDIEMPEMNGYEVLKHLKAGDKTRDIPVIFLTSQDDPADELEGLSLGAIDYITKPFSPSLLVQRIENHLLIVSQKRELKKYNEQLREMVLEQTGEIEKLQYAVISTVAEVVEFRDDIAGGHIERTQGYMKILLDELIEKNIYREEISSWDLDFIIPATQLHDVGKIMINPDIMNKPGKLSPEEFEKMKRHPEYGERIIERMIRITSGHSFLYHARIFAASHHEKWDGTGYPRGLAGTAIPLQGRLMAIADVYDALIALRPYKQPMSPGEAEKIILEGAGSSFDPALVEAFKAAAPRFAKIAARHDILV